MEFPFGHGGHHHHHRPETNEPDPNRYPPPSQPGQYQPPFGYDGPPPQQPGHYQPPSGYDGPPPGHQPYGEVGGGYGYNPPPPPVHQYGGGGGGYPPNNSSYDAQHGSNEGGGGGTFGHHHQHQSRPQEHGGSYVHHVGHEGGSGGFQPTVRIYTKAEENYSLSIRDGKVVLARADHTDPYQHWIRDLKYSTRVKDEEGFPSFALVNKVTGEALKHSIGATHPVRLIPYNADYLDESVLWTESKDLGDGFRCIRMVNNIRLNFDAFHGDEDHGGVRDGTTVVLWEWLKGKNQRWKIVSY
ncbi:uncharacterized protein M6B38_356915 [Iris pallida]|uniref:Ricin B-like lectin R40G3 n=1 Tax=Iris pallida TaxID=29817 RepID=A0AAX6GM35_IRIPA|nr:uncharacterized protein M6B38_356915 [Iris pallida]